MFKYFGRYEQYFHVFKRPSKLGYLYMICVIFTFYISHLREEDAKNTPEYIISTRDTILKSIYNGDFELGIVNGNGRYEYNPDFKIVDSFFRWELFVSNVGNSIARVTQVRTCVVLYQYGIPRIASDVVENAIKMGRDSIVTPSMGIVCIRRYPKIQEEEGDSAYLCIRIDYTNEKGTVNKTYNDIFLFDSKFSNKDIPRPYDERFEQTRKFLTHTNIW